MSYFEKVRAFPNLYKIDTKGKLRVWRMNLGLYGDRAAHQAESGLLDGERVTSGWKEAFPKNTGKVNATDAHEQALKEIVALYEKRVERGASYTSESAGSYSKFVPMLAQKYKDGMNFGAGYIEIFSQPKLDGIRCIARADGLWTRSGKEITTANHIWQELLPLFDDHPEIVLDGELYNHDLHDDFNLITSLVRRAKPTQEEREKVERLIQYHVYDCFVESDPELVFSERNLLLEQYFSVDTRFVKMVQTEPIFSQEHLDNSFAHYLTEGYEGQMVRIDRPYENKRSKTLLKRKVFTTKEFEVKGMYEGQGTWSGHIKRFEIFLQNGNICGAGVRGKQDVLKKLLNENKTPDWATVRFFGYTEDGSLRFPVVVDWGWGERKD